MGWSFFPLSSLRWGGRLIAQVYRSHMRCIFTSSFISVWKPWGVITLKYNFNGRCEDEHCVGCICCYDMMVVWKDQTVSSDTSGWSDRPLYPLLISSSCHYNRLIKSHGWWCFPTKPSPWSTSFYSCGELDSRKSGSIRTRAYNNGCIERKW